MKLLGFGLRSRDGSRVFPPMDESTFAAGLVPELERRVSAPVPEVRTLAMTATPLTFGGGLAPQCPKDATVPTEVGWTYVVSESDPARPTLEELIEPLARHRALQTGPLVYPASADERHDWIDEQYLGIEARERPRYVLLVGSPEHIPFELQSALAATAAIVGRVDFDEAEHLASYVRKVIELETSTEPSCRPEALVFAPDGGPTDPTYYSHRYMATPIAELIDRSPPFSAERLFGDAATKEALLSQLSSSRPALVYTASHGAFAGENDGLEAQRASNGAICCQQVSASDDYMFTAADVPPDDTPFCPGGVFVQFACWGYGTPRDSFFAGWLGEDTSRQTETAFVAALPKRLLAHPQGPIAYIGHVDTAFLHGFADPENPTPELGALYDARLEPFRTAIDYALLRLWPSGFALDDLENRAASFSVALGSVFDAMQREGKTTDTLTPEQLRDLVDLILRRNDAMNFLLLGDPAVRLHVQG